MVSPSDPPQKRGWPLVDLTCPVPSLQSHYRAFVTTADWSAPVLRNGTLPAVAIAPSVLPCDDLGAEFTHFDWPFRSKRQVLLFPASACDELKPPIHRAPPGPRAGCYPTGDVHMHAFVTGRERGSPLAGFDAVIEYFDVSAVAEHSLRRRSPTSPPLPFQDIHPLSLLRSVILRNSAFVGRWFMSTPS